MQKQKDKDLIVIDGSFGEGGGQILRTALLLSIATGKGFEISNIRAKRPKPGLLHQHLAAVNAFTKVTSSTVLGGELGSTNLRFIPGKVVADKVRIDVGTAGSITLILATLLPALSISGAEVSIQITGGTDTKWSPTYDYFENVVLQLYNRIGVRTSSRLVKRGYYPAGGGEVSAEIHRSEKLFGLKSIEKQDKVVRGRSVCSILPLQVAERQAESARRLLQENGIMVDDIEVRRDPASSPGTAIALWHVDAASGIFVGSDAVGERGLLAEEVGRRAAVAFVRARRAPLDPHIADVAIPLLALAHETSEIVFPEVTGHIRSNIYTAELFTKRRFELSEGKELAKLCIY
ncbi:MAG: RNA 3'-terminal phosphate cyclase [Conexivisphaerales archaeon]